MDNQKEAEKASKYLNEHNEHIESPQAENHVNQLLKNPDANLLDKFLDTREITTPFFTITGLFSSININDLVTSVVENERKKLEKEGKLDPGAQGKLAGTKIGLQMRLESTGEYPIQKINKLVIKNGGSLDLLSSLPQNYQVIWAPGGSIDKSAHDLKNELIILNGDITSPEGLLVTLHEIGHYIDLKDDPERNEQLPEIQANMIAPTPEELKSMPPEFAKLFLDKFKPVTDSDIKMFIEAERNAWAFALKTISTLTNNRDLIHACKEYIHQQPLRMQGDFLRSRNLYH